MDPFTIRHLAHERILDLQRTAEQIRQERELQLTQPAETRTAPTRQTELRRAPEKAGRCTPAETAT